MGFGIWDFGIWFGLAWVWQNVSYDRSAVKSEVLLINLFFITHGFSFINVDGLVAVILVKFLLNVSYKVGPLKISCVVCSVIDQFIFYYSWIFLFTTDGYLYFCLVIRRDTIFTDWGWGWILWPLCFYLKSGVVSIKLFTIIPGKSNNKQIITQWIGSDSHLFKYNVCFCLVLLQ